MKNSIIIKNGFVIDGTGKPTFKADILIQGDKIEDIGSLKDVKTSIILNLHDLY